MKVQGFLFASLAVLTVAGAANAITPAYEYTSSTALYDSRPFTLGFEFSLSSSVTIDALGFNGLGLVSDPLVGIWDASGNLLTSVDVLPTDPMTGHFLYHAITPITLGPGTYTIGGEYDGGGELFPSGAVGVTTVPGFTWIQDEQIEGSGLNYPTLTTGGDYGQNGIPIVDFSVAGVPEPAAWALMLVGFGGLGGALRARRRTALA